MQKCPDRYGTKFQLDLTAAKRGRLLMPHTVQRLNVLLQG